MEVLAVLRFIINWPFNSKVSHPAVLN